MAIGRLRLPKKDDPFGSMRDYVEYYYEPNKLTTNVAKTAEAGLNRLYNSVTKFGDPTPDQVNQLKDYIQRNTASGAFGANFKPGFDMNSLIKRSRESNSSQPPGAGSITQRGNSLFGSNNQPPSAGNAVFGGVSIPGNFATGVGRGDMLPPKPRMNDEYGMRLSRIERNPETLKQRRLRQREDMSRAF